MGDLSKSFLPKHRLFIFLSTHVVEESSSLVTNLDMTIRSVTLNLYLKVCSYLKRVYCSISLVCIYVAQNLKIIFFFFFLQIQSKGITYHTCYRISTSSASGFSLIIRGHVKLNSTSKVPGLTLTKLQQLR